MLLGHTNRGASNCHTNRSVKLPSFRHFQDQFLATNKEKWGKKNGPVFRRVFVFLTFRGPLASHDSNPYPTRSHIARYNATKLVGFQTLFLEIQKVGVKKGESKVGQPYLTAAQHLNFIFPRKRDLGTPETLCKEMP